MRIPAFLECAALALGVACLAFVTGCEPLDKIEEDEEVEIAPGNWLTVHRIDWCVQEDYTPRYSLPQERTRLTMNWAGQQVTWESIAVPITLREWEGRLYIVGYDRETDPDKPRFRYYRQKGNGFEEIKPQDFPKRIATQNMWLENYEQSRLAMTQGVDLDAKGFHGSFTAQMWAHLLTGDDKYGEYSVDDPAILRRFKEKYHPIPLPTIRKATAERLDEEPEPK